MVLLLFQGLLPVALVYLTKLVVDSLVGALGTGGDWDKVQPVLVLVGMMAGVMLLTQLLLALTSWIREAQAELLKDHISDLIHQKSIEVDLAFYESSDFYDHLHRARDESGYRPVSLLEGMGSLLQNGVTLLAMAAVLLRFGWWLPTALLVSTLPALFVVLRHAVRQHRWRLRKSQEERRSWYYGWLLTDRITAAEIRLFDLGDHYRTAFQKLRARLRGERLRLVRERGISELVAGLIALLITGTAMAWMVWKALQGLVTLGDLALFYQAFNRGQQLMRSLLEQVGRIYSNTLFLGNLFEFLALRPKVVDGGAPGGVPAVLQHGITFDRVSFQYPGSERLALDDFSLHIPAAKMTAIVGENGAGKSTLTKLICRLYDPVTGSVSLDNRDLRDLSLEELRRRITVLFQEPVHYNTTVAENISLGDLNTILDPEAIKRAARAAAADRTIEALPEGYGTLLGRWFKGGAELSVGEWQRIALARAFLREAPILLLDEPTSAMDSWAEADWLERLRETTARRTTLLITHRFTTARLADIIHVMVGGRIVESGSHDQLLARGGSYAESWNRQTESFPT